MLSQIPYNDGTIQFHDLLEYECSCWFRRRGFSVSCSKVSRGTQEPRRTKQLDISAVDDMW